MNYLPFDLEKALKGEPYGVLSPKSGFQKADFPPHQLPEWHDWSIAVRADNSVLYFNSVGETPYDDYRLVMLPPDPKVEYRYANEYVDHVVGCHDAIEMCNSRNGFNRIGIIRYTYHDGRLMPELTVRIEDYRK